MFFDIGANIGVYSLNMFRKAGWVYSFEATRTTADTLMRTIEENSIKNIHLCFNAVDEKDGVEVTIYSGESSLGDENNGSNSMHTGTVVANTVKTITIDKFVSENGLARLDIMKLDIEGNELFALKGAKETITRFRPIIFVEINPELNKKAGYTANELFDFVITQGYEAKVLTRGNLKRIDKYKAVSRQQNIFFFPQV